MCSNRVLWLLSYIGLSVALALGNGNRQSAALEPRSASSPIRQPQQQHSRVRDWLSYDTRAALPHERLVLLDDVLTNVLDDLQHPSKASRGDELSPRSRRSRPQAQQAKRRNPLADKSKRRISASRRQQQQQQQQIPQQDPQEIAQALAQAGQSMAASNFMFNSRNDRSYDVPLIECPMSEDGMERFACPTADRMGRYHCIDDHVLCDGYLDCPMGEDEDMQACMFYKTTKAHIDILADALLRWARGR